MNRTQTHAAVLEIRILTGVLTKLARRDLEQRLGTSNCGISSELQCGVLRLLSHHEYTISELSRKMILEPATLVPVVDTLERNGLVKRGQDPKDRRRTPLLLTEHGAAVVSQIPAVAETDMLFKALTKIGPERYEQLLILLRELVSHMDADVVGEVSRIVRTQTEGQHPDD